MEVAGLPGPCPMVWRTCRPPGLVENRWGRVYQNLSYRIERRITCGVVVIRFSLIFFRADLGDFNSLSYLTEDYTCG
jgi:hypothetical protein